MFCGTLISFVLCYIEYESRGQIILEVRSFMCCISFQEIHEALWPVEVSTDPAGKRTIYFCLADYFSNLLAHGAAYHGCAFLFIFSEYTIHITHTNVRRTWFGEYRNETLFLIMYYQGFISSKELVPLFYLVKPASIPYLHARRVQTDSGIRVVSGEKGQQVICLLY